MNKSWSAVDRLDVLCNFECLLLRDIMRGSKAHYPPSPFWPVKATCLLFLSRMLTCASKLLTCCLPPIVSWKFVQHSVCPAQGHLWHEERPQYILVYFIAKWAEM